jgi:ribosomal protein S18 acetylase RimI-like enzyme
MSDRVGPLHIRLANVGDVAVLTSLVEEAYTPWIETVGRRPRPMDDDYQLRCREGQAWVAEQDAKLVGALVIEDMPGFLFLHNIAVTPASQRRGLGRALMQFVEDQGRGRGYDQVRLTTSEVMARNVALYTRLGYVVTQREPTTTVDRLWMTKLLG